MKTAQTCYLCQAPATTFDHIPPKSLFPKDFQYKGVKVPACKSCNNATSKDDEYLRDCFAMTGWNKEARQVFLEGVRPSYLRPYAMMHQVTKHQKILNSMAKIDIKSPSGIFLRKVTAMKMKSDRVENALKKIVKGLHFHRYKKSIPDNYTLKVYFQPTDIGLNLLDEAKKKGALNAGRFGNTFCYMGFNVREDEFVGIWWLSFYQTHAAILMVDSSNKLLG
ncbi:MAG: hypothetical protein A2860_02380 [Candidatus Levybacteria bacterium RIFCSPHIGHO2_01_FULL_37_33]|nr:MAG: hypothetical protein A2860_02380 [Candidatus Levybacteria bacterium RIFCSPHIGHO2_01_FULL_37_33]OGH15803.1 MAG: hypothetical protein A3C97_00985 [Candidatus Levybacteria bacterium RIFCSPHIGHO2_02_FULL_37_11]